MRKLSLSISLPGRRRKRREGFRLEIELFRVQETVTSQNYFSIDAL
jgi:hypothetical protein